MNNRERLIELMLAYRLERRELADLVRATRAQVDAWLLPAESRAHQPVPDMAIELLELKLAGRPATPPPGAGTA
ncbi:MAG: hypothetical protein AB7Q97_13635 [Gammaproteobacteria bacterium]